MLKLYHYNRPERPPTLKIQPYDLEILKLIDAFRVVDSELLYHLLNRRLDKPLSYDNLKRRLKKLWEAKYLDRPPEQVVLAIRSGQRHLIYTLAKEGLELLKGNLTSVEVEKLKTLKRVKKRKGWSKEGNHSYLFLEHALSISRFRAALELAGLPPLLWLGDGEVQHRVRFQPMNPFQARVLNLHPEAKEKVAVTLKPDAFFSLKRERDGKVLFHALELDRGSEKLTSVGRKILAYYKILKGLRLSQTPLVVENQPVSHFRVLFVAPDQRRIDQLKQVVRGIDERAPQRGDRSFWFARQEQINWREPKSILERIWQTTPGEVFSLLD